MIWEILKNNKYIVLVAICFLIISINLYILERFMDKEEKIKKIEDIAAIIAIPTTIAVIYLINFFFQMEIF